MDANSQLEGPIATVEMQFEVGGLTFKEKFIIMANLTNTLDGLLSLKGNSRVLGMRQGILNFHFFSMQFTNEDRTYPKVIEPILNPVGTTQQPGERTTIRVISHIHRFSEATIIFQSSPFLESDDELLICPALSTSQNNIPIVQLSNFLDHPYTLEKGTHLANFSILTPKQTKHLKTVTPKSVRHFLNNNHDDANHVSDTLLRMSKTDGVKEVYWFPTP